MRRGWGTAVLATALALSTVRPAGAGARIRPLLLPIDFQARSIGTRSFDLVPAEAGDEEGDKGSAALAKIWKAETAKVRKLGLEPDMPAPAAPVPFHGKPVELQAVGVPTIERLRLLNHANVPLKVLMVCTGETRDEVQGTFETVKAINEEEALDPRETLKLHLIPASPSALKGLRIGTDDLKKYVEIDRYFSTNDIWMQDWGEIAAVQVKGADHERTLVFDSRRGRGLIGLPDSLAREWSSGYLRYEKLEDGPCGNYGGNIEVTPSDELVIGSTSTKTLRDLLAGCGYRDRMVVLDTGWLVVGHVDEFSCELPTPGTELGYTIVKADPRLAMELLKGMKDPEASLRAMVQAYFAAYPRFPDLYEQDLNEGQDLFMGLGALQAHLAGSPEKFGPFGSLAEKLVKQNEDAAARIDANIETMRAFLRKRHGDAVRIDVVSFPSLFTDQWGKLVAFAPGVVNMVVLRNRLLVPDPLLPEFRDAIRQTAASVGFRAHFVANSTYHFRDGQLHCGTNVFRHPNRYVHPRYADVHRAQKQISTGD